MRGVRRSREIGRKKREVEKCKQENNIIMDKRLNRPCGWGGNVSQLGKERDNVQAVCVARTQC